MSFLAASPRETVTQTADGVVAVDATFTNGRGGEGTGDDSGSREEARPETQSDTICFYIRTAKTERKGQFFFKSGSAISKQRIAPVPVTVPVGKK